MRTKKQLQRLLSEIAGENAGGKASVIARGLPYYGVLRKEYPTHFKAFTHMQSRCESYDIECDFTHDEDGFVEFLLYVGDVPRDMKRPTLGRINHSEGYVKGNFQWQSLSDNSREVRVRRFKENLHLKGEKVGNSKISDKLAAKIKNFLSKKTERGWSKRKVARHVAEKTGKSYHAIHRIVMGVSYRHVE